MEEDIRKQGMLYLQQQRFGKKWKRVWCVLYMESSCSISRLEFFDCKEGANVEKNDKSLRKQQESKKVIRLSDCIRVSEVELDGCPRDTGSFLVETTEKMFVFASDRNQLDDWTHKLCEIAFPMSWTDHGSKRGNLQRGGKVDEDECMEDNFLYSGRDTVRDFRVCVRRTDASDRCRLKGDSVLRADVNALHLLDKSGDKLYSWPYRYLRRFGRDKSTFSFEAGRRCDSGEGSFEFDTKEGNFLFHTVEAAINLQKISFPSRQTSGGGAGSQETLQILPLPPPPVNPPQNRLMPQTRGQVSLASTLQETDGVYSMVNEPATLQMVQQKDPENSTALQKQLRPQMSHLEPPVDKMLTAVKSLTLDTRGLPAPRKNQVKMISSCPLPNASPELPPSSTSNPNPRLSPKPSPSGDEMYSQVNMPVAPGRGTKKGIKNNPPPSSSITNKDSEYSLPFDTITSNVMSDILNSHQGYGSESGADPLYDSIDEMKIRNIPTSKVSKLEAPYKKIDHIYDEPEGCACPAIMAVTIPYTEPSPIPIAAVYDDPEEMRGDAWKIMGTTVDPKGHEYPYNPREDDYAVPKRPKRAFVSTQLSPKEAVQGGGEELEDEERTSEEEDSTYNNIKGKKE